MFHGKHKRFLGNNNYAGSTQTPNFYPVSRSQLKTFWQGMHNKLFLRLPSFNYIYFMAKLFSIASPTDKLFQALESSKPVNILLVVLIVFLSIQTVERIAICYQLSSNVNINNK